MLHHKMMACVLAGCVLSLSTARADEFSYGFGVQEAVGLSNEVFQGDDCYVRVRGPRGGSQIKGTYDNPDGVLIITVEYSYLEIRGRAKKVIVRYVDTHSGLDLTNLQIGEGGVVIKSVDNASSMEIGHCEGPVQIRSVDNASVISLQRGTKVEGKDRISKNSRLYFRK